MDEEDYYIDEDYNDYDNTHGGVCLNCGSAKCGTHGGCSD